MHRVYLGESFLFFFFPRAFRLRIPKRCKGVHCVDLGDSFPTHIYLQKSASIHPRTSPVKFARSPCTDQYYYRSPRCKRPHEEKMGHGGTLAALQARDGIQKMRPGSSPSGNVITRTFVFFHLPSAIFSAGVPRLTGPDPLSFLIFAFIFMSPLPTAS